VKLQQTLSSIAVSLISVIALLLLAPTPGFAQPRAAVPTVVGVWKIVEIVTTGANAGTNSNPQPNLLIFTNGYYSLLQVLGTQPRPKLEPLKTPGMPTDAEKIARYEESSLFTANSGTYQISGTTITFRPLVAKAEGVMSGPGFRREFKLEGDTLSLTSPVSKTRVSLIRVE